MNFKVIKQLFKKEMLDVLRDKKTVLMMVVVPLIIYPLIIVFSMQIMSSVSQDMAKSTYKIAIEGDDKSEFARLIEDYDSGEVSVEILFSDDMQSDLLEGNIDAYLSVGLHDKDIYMVDINYLSASSKSSYAVDVVLEILEYYEDEMTQITLVNAGLNPDEVLDPIKVNYHDMSTAEESTGNLLGSILPFMLVVSILMGTMYPAIDTTSGEKERGTLETVLTLPITSKELIFSKFLAVSVFGIASAVLNLISMCGVMAYMLNMMKSMGTSTFDDIDISRFIGPVLIGVLCVFAFAVFVSALSMCVCAFAKSYKEANNYITPVTLVVMMASFITFLPNIQLTKTMSLVPVVNICMLLRDLLIFKINYLSILLVLFSNIIYGVVAVLILGKIYNSESIMFGDGQSGIQLFEKRSNMKKGGVPTLGDCGFVIILMTVIYLYVGSSIQLSYGTTGLVLSQLLFVIVPLLIVIYSRKSIKDTFRLRGCDIKKLLGGVILGVGVIIWGLVISTICSNIFRESAATSQEGLMSYVPKTFVLGVLVMALTPAICEEMFFRGYVFSSLEAKLKVNTAILLSAALFGVFHMSLAKFLGTAFLGGMIAYIGYKTRSIFPGMVVHFMNNLLSCVAIYYPVELVKAIPVLGYGDSKERSISGLLVLIVAVICTFVGTWLLRDKTYKMDNRVTQ